MPCLLLETARLFENCSSEREFALTSRMFEPTHVGCYEVLKEAPASGVSDLSPRRSLLILSRD